MSITSLNSFLVFSAERRQQHNQEADSVLRQPGWDTHTHTKINMLYIISTHFVHHHTHHAASPLYNKNINCKQQNRFAQTQSGKTTSMQWMMIRNVCYIFMICMYIFSIFFFQSCRIFVSFEVCSLLTCSPLPLGGAYPCHGHHSAAGHHVCLRHSLYCDVS